jgi:phage baseplate assembly protein W
LTNPGDIDEEPEFGVGASSYLGENMNPVDIMSLKERIQTQCTRYEPRAEVTSVLVNADYEGHTLSLRITYTPVNVDTEETLTIEVTRVL